MNIVKVKLSELKLDPNNARKHSPQNILAIKQSLQENPQYRPFVVQKGTNKICVGNGMYIAMKELGIKEGWVEYRDLDDKQFARLSVADNRTAELAEWDEDILQQIISNYGDDITIPGFGDDVSFNLDDDKEITEDEVPEITEEVVSVLGDVWKLGRHRLMCGDATDKATVEKLMNGVKADMVFTDPPYGTNVVSKSGVLSKTYKTDIMNDDTNEVAIDCFLLCQQMFNDAKQVWWGANYYTECLPSSECWIVWDKNNGASDQTDCELAWANFRSVVRQFTLASEKKNRVHPTQKPIKLIAMIFEKFEKENKFNNVVDLFGGSGSTLIACEQLNRTCYMMELDPKYVDVIIQRYIAFKGTSDDVYRINADGTKTKYEDII